MNKKIIVDNWKQVYKSLAVLLPTAATVIYAGLVETGQISPIDPMYITIIVGIAGALGWTIKQPNIKKGIR